MDDEDRFVASSAGREMSIQFVRVIAVISRVREQDLENLYVSEGSIFAALCLKPSNR